MFASIFAAQNGHEVHVYEKMKKLGKKLFITGKGRCNVTNAADMEGYSMLLFQSKVFIQQFLWIYQSGCRRFFRITRCEDEDREGKPGFPGI